MIENEVHAIIVETMHKRHNLFRATQYRLGSLEWKQHNKNVKQEIDAQAIAIVKALDGYLA